MNADALRHFFNYHFAENRKLWEQYVMALSPEQFVRGAAYAHGSVRNQVVHLLDVDDVWFSSLQGLDPFDPLPITGSDDDRDSIRDHWDRVEQKMRAYLDELDDNTLSTQPITEPEEDRDLFVWQVLLHVVNHGTDHRAQMLRLLHDLGVNTTSQDYVFFVYDNP